LVTERPGLGVPVAGDVELDGEEEKAGHNIINAIPAKSQKRNCRAEMPFLIILMNLPPATVQVLISAIYKTTTEHKGYIANALRLEILDKKKPPVRRL
jgi:hypothetical protein